MGRKNNNKTDPSLKKAIYKSRLQNIERELCNVTYIIEKLNEGEDLLMQERMFLLDNLYVKLHKLQKRRDYYYGEVAK